MGFSIKKVIKKAKKYASNPLTYLNPTTYISTDIAKDQAKKLGILPGSQELPDVPGLSEAERALIAKQIALLDKGGLSIQQAQDLYDRITGLYNPDGSLNNQKAEQLGELDQLALERYRRALIGDVAPSEALQQEEADAFRLFRAQQARRGGGVQGTNFNNAIAGTTAGNQRLMGFGKIYGLRKDEERRAELADAPSRLGFVSNYATNRADIASGYAPLVGGYGNALLPFRQQRELEYNRQLAQYGKDRGRESDLLGLAGDLFGTLAGRRS